MQARERLIDLLMSGGSVAQAFAQVEREHVHKPGHARLKYVVDFDGGINNLPDAACVAQQLADKPKRTRQDVLDAFAACSKPK